MPITSLRFTDVGPFGDIEFEFDEHVNVFTGPNNSGKSTALIVLGDIFVYYLSFPQKLLRSNSATWEATCRSGGESRSFQDLEAAYQEGLLDAGRAKCFSKQRAKEELYNVKVDPYSMKNLANDPALEDVLVGYRSILDEWRKSTNDSNYEQYRPPHNAGGKQQ